MLNRLKFLIIGILPVLSVFFFFVPSAEAAPMYTIYAYGSGYIEIGILQSIASVLASGGFSLILKSVVLIGFVMIFLQMIITSFKVSPHKSLVKYFAAVMVIYSALLIPRVNVTVYDTVNNTSSNATVVSGVPWGIGVIASYFSDFQYYMTTALEKNFSTPNSIDMTNAGMGFSLTSQNLANGIQVDDPYLFQSFTQYVYNCILPGISTGGLSSQALTQAGMSVAANSTTYEQNDLLGYAAIYTTGAGANLTTTEYSATGGDGSPQGTTTTCSAQAADMQNDFTNYVNNDAGPQLAGALGMTYATFASQYGLVNSSIYNMSSSATSELVQMAAVNQYNQALIQSAVLAGVNPSQLTFGSAMAQENMNSSFAISGQLAGEYMPVVYGIFSALFLAFSLFLIILMALPIGATYLKMYLELGLFLAIWPALMAVYNYVMDLIVRNGYTYLATQGYSIDSAHTVNLYVSHQLGIMGYLSWSVPLIAYALVSGSTYAMTGAISAIDSSAKSGAAAGAGMASTGNLSLGNDSLGNRSMDNLSAMDISTNNTRRYNTNENKYDTAHKTTIGQEGIDNYSIGPGGRTQMIETPEGKRVYSTTNNGTTTSVKKYLGTGSSVPVAAAYGDTATGLNLGFSKNGLVTSATDPNISGSIGQSISSIEGKTWSNNAAKTTGLLNKKGSLKLGSLEQNFSNDKTQAAMRAIEQTHGLTSSVKSELQHYVEGGASFGMQDGVFGVEVAGGFKQLRNISKSQELSLMQKYSTNLSNKLSHSKALKAVMSSTQGRELTKSLNDTISSGQSYSFARSNNGTVQQNALVAYLNKMNEPLRKAGATDGELKKYDNGIIKGLEKDPAPLLNFVKENPNLQLNGNAIKEIKSSGKIAQSKIAGIYKSLAPGTSFASVSKDISTAAQKRYGYSTNGQKEVKYADNINAAKQLYKKGALSKSMEQKYIAMETKKLNAARGIEKNIPGINGKINKARGLVSVGQNPKNPIQPSAKLTAPQGVAWKSSMTIKHPNDSNFKPHSDFISTVKKSDPIKPPSK